MSTSGCQSAIVSLVAALQLHDPLAGAFLELLRLGELRVGLLVEAVEIALLQTFGGDVFAEVEQMLDQHAERTAPVADVVLADHVVAEELEHPHQRVADHGRAEVAGVHLLGDVRRRVVDDDRRRVAAGATPSRSSVATSSSWPREEVRRRT